MAVVINAPEPTTLKIRMVEKDGRVELVYNHFAFVRCFTNAEGRHVVELHDADTGLLKQAQIEPTCWKR